MNNEKNLIVKSRINNLMARVRMRNQESFAYDIFVTLAKLGEYFLSIFDFLSEAEIESMDLLFRSAEVVDNKFESNGERKSEEQRLRELNAFTDAVNQTLYYYQLHRGYNIENHKEMKEKNSIIKEFNAQIILANEILQYLTYCKNVAANDNSLTPTIKSSSVEEYYMLENYLKSFIDNLNNKKQSIMDNTYSVTNRNDYNNYLKEVVSINDDLINSINNSTDLFELKANTFLIKARINDLNSLTEGLYL